jgi:hypothetical protein
LTVEHPDRYGSPMTTSERGPALTTAAVLFGVLAVSNLLKPFQLVGEETGFVFFGQRLDGGANAILGPLFGIYLLAYATGIWGMRRYALPLGRLYAAYVIVNLVLFSFRTPPPPGAGLEWKLFGLVYAAVAITVSVGTWRLLAKRQSELG